MENVIKMSSGRILQAYIESLVCEAYLNWQKLEEVEGSLNEPALLLTQGIYKFCLANKHKEVQLHGKIMHSL